MSRRVLFVSSVLAGIAALGLSASLAVGAPKPSPTPTPTATTTAAPYTLGQQVIESSVQEVIVEWGAVSVTANCPSGKVPTGGGFKTNDGLNANTPMAFNGPAGNGWKVTWKNPDSSFPLTTYVVCVNKA